MVRSYLIDKGTMNSITHLTSKSNFFLTPTILFGDPLSSATTLNENW